MMAKTAGNGTLIKPLEYELAGVMDTQCLVSTCYNMEGDRLEILFVYDALEDLRQFGRTLGDAGTLPSLDAKLRRDMALKKGSKIRMPYEAFGMCEAEVIKVDKAESEFERTEVTKQKKTVKMFTVKFTDGHEQDLEDCELHQWLVLDSTKESERNRVIASIKPAFDYLENRITGNCDAQYSMVKNYHLFDIVRMFDPARGHELGYISGDKIDELAADLPTLGVAKFNGATTLVAQMKAELATYQRLAREKFDHDKAVAVDRDNDYDGLKRELSQPFVSGGGAYICSCAGGKDVEGSTNTILEFWTQHEDEIPCVRAQVANCMPSMVSPSSLAQGLGGGCVNGLRAHAQQRRERASVCATQVDVWRGANERACRHSGVCT